MNKDNNKSTTSNNSKKPDFPKLIQSENSIISNDLDLSELPNIQNNNNNISDLEIDINDTSDLKQLNSPLSEAKTQLADINTKNLSNTPKPPKSSSNPTLSITPPLENNKTNPLQSQAIVNEKLFQTGELTGTLFEGKYKVGHLLGEGGMGQVYKATHVMMKKEVALKILLPPLGANLDIIERFRREAESAAKLQHENIINVLDFGRASTGTFYLIMEYVEGVPLSDILVSGPMHWKRASDIAIQILSALEVAHSKGIIHRDLKPDNIMIQMLDGGREIVKILDFGIAKLAESDSNSINVTKAGMIFGTPAYLSPEQGLGRQVTPASDLYSFGIMFFQMLTGNIPFDGDNPMEIIAKHLNEAPPRLKNLIPEIPNEIDTLILSTLSKNPDKRPQSAYEIKKTLAHLLNKPTFKTTIPINITEEIQDFLTTSNGKLLIFILGFLVITVGFFIIFMKSPNQVIKSPNQNIELTEQYNKQQIKKQIKEIDNKSPIKMLINQKKYDQALILAESNLKKNPSNAKALKELELIHKIIVAKGKKQINDELSVINDTRDLEARIELLKKWIDWFPQDGNLYYLLSLVYSKIKSHSKSLSYMSKAILLNNTLTQKIGTKVYLSSYLKYKKQWIRHKALQILKISFSKSTKTEVKFLVQIINDKKTDVDTKYELYRFSQKFALAGINIKYFWTSQLKWSTSCKVKIEAANWFAKYGVKKDIKFLKKEAKKKYYRVGSGKRISTSCYKKKIYNAIHQIRKRKI